MKPSVLTRYRVMAYVTAVMLLVLSTCMVFKYGFGMAEDATFVVSQTHGLLYIIYLVFAFDLAQKARMPFGKLLWVLLSGTIPFVKFFVERRITAEVRPLVVTEDDEPRDTGSATMPEAYRAPASPGAGRAGAV